MLNSEGCIRKRYKFPARGVFLLHSVVKSVYSSVTLELDFYLDTHLGRAESPREPNLANNKHAINLQEEQRLNAYPLLSRNGLEIVVHDLSEGNFMRTLCVLEFPQMHTDKSIYLVWLNLGRHN